MMAKQNRSLSVNYVVVCDEIRKEDNGKYIIIGVYLDNISVPRFPFDMTLAFWISIVPHREGEILCQWRLKHDIAGVLSSSAGKLTIYEKEKDSIVTLRRIPVKLPQEGILSLQFREKGRRWRILKIIPVTLQKGDS
jgi:hypothetical protein